MLREIPKIKGKKAWIKIVEAFIAVLLILSAALIVLSNERKQVDRPAEITKLLSSILDVIGRDGHIRSEILSNSSNNTYLANLTIEKIIPSWLDYSSRVCSFGVTCANPIGYINKPIYSDEILIAANLTYIAPEPVKFNIFLCEK